MQSKYPVHQEKYIVHKIPKKHKVLSENTYLITVAVIPVNLAQKRNITTYFKTDKTGEDLAKHIINTVVPTIKTDYNFSTEDECHVTMLTDLGKDD